MSTVFQISAIIAIISTLLAISRMNAIHALLYFILSLLAVAVVLFTLGAPFIAALEVIIYAGAIMVVFVFVVMMLNAGDSAAEHERKWLTPEMWGIPSFFAAILLSELIYLLTTGQVQVLVKSSVTPEQVGIALYGPYVLGVEMVSILLLTGLLGASHLARRNLTSGRQTRKETAP